MEPLGGLRRFGKRCSCGTAHARYFLEFSGFLTLPRARATYWGAPTDKEILAQLPGWATGLPTRVRLGPFHPALRCKAAFGLQPRGTTIRNPRHDQRHH